MKISAATRKQIEREDRAFKSAAVKWISAEYVAARAEGFTGPVMDAVLVALNDLSKIGSEALRNLGLDLQERAPALSC